MWLVKIADGFGCSDSDALFPCPLLNIRYALLYYAQSAKSKTVHLELFMRPVVASDYAVWGHAP